MSSSNQVFISNNISILELKPNLEELLNVQLEKRLDVEWELYSATILGLQISLFEAKDFEDDRELNLSQFNYLIDINCIRNTFDIGYESEWKLITSKIIGSMISGKLNCECLVVDDMQSLVERFLPFSNS